jgi:YHS domain-containing protein
LNDLLIDARAVEKQKNYGRVPGCAEQEKSCVGLIFFWQWLIQACSFHTVFCPSSDKLNRLLVLVYSQIFYNMKIVIALAAFLFVVTGCGQKSEVYSNSSRAINGYDPVAYFTEGKPVKGSDEFTYKWKGATWYFSSKQNLDSFENDPEKFAPQYGGYCAYGCSNDRKVPTDPNAWTIVDGKLYLNKSLEVKEMWMKEQEERINKADKNWIKLKDSK